MPIRSNKISIPSLLQIGEGELCKIGFHIAKYGFKNVAVFYSAGIEELFGQKIKDGLNNAQISIIHSDSIDDINIENVIHTAFEIPKKADALIGVGGGKALDYSKYCAHVLNLPFITVPTSTSNDGFCSPNASLLVEGARKSINSTIPFGVVVDIDAIISSPENCIFSGIGDLLSKITACWDWRESAKRNNSSLNDFAYIISQNSVYDFLNYQNKPIRDKVFLERLVNSLLMSGVAMEMAQSSRPASGSEHLISHALDRVSAGKSQRMHGIQVGVSTYLCSILQDNNTDLIDEFFETTGFWRYVYNNPLDKSDFIQSIKKAPFVKEDFFTVLSLSDSSENALETIEKDNRLKKAIV